MKKTTSKPAAKSPAPATKAAPAAKPAIAAAKPPVVAPKAEPVVKATKPAAKKKPAASATPAAPAAASAPAAPAVPAAAPAVKPVATKPVVTTIEAQIDIGFGNALYVRGEGAGLSWDKGLLMSCVNDDTWQVALGESAHPIVFKFLVNDLSWSVGEDYTVAAGSSVTLAPVF